ncbi:MAG: YlxR family protein [Actinomyces sp.]|nr:MAG: YlxR family protein [Actinomyces sp.]
MTLSEPVRTCVACRRRFPASALVRLRRTSDGLALGPGPGRGAWVGPSRACLELAVKRRALGRALRFEANAAELARLHDSWPPGPPDCPYGPV